MGMPEVWRGCCRGGVALLAVVVAAGAGCIAAGGRAAPGTSPVERFEKADRLRASLDRDSAQRPLLFASLGDEAREVPVQQRVVIYNAGFRIVVLGIAEALERMEQIAAQSGGYVQEIKGDRITIRVPVAQYAAAVERVQTLGQVVDRELQSIDVTEEYVDLEARLSNARNVRKRLEALLEKAENVEAALAVEKELSRISEEIERLEAKLELIRRRVAYSTISAQFERVARQTELLRGYQRLPFEWLRELDPNRLWTTE